MTNFVNERLGYIASIPNSSVTCVLQAWEILTQGRPVILYLGKSLLYVCNHLAAVPPLMPKSTLHQIQSDRPLLSWHHFVMFLIIIGVFRFLYRLVWLTQNLWIGWLLQESLSLFCETCDKLTCRDCQLTDHRDHKYKFIHEIAEETKSMISGLLSEVT